MRDTGRGDSDGVKDGDGNGLNGNGLNGNEWLFAGRPEFTEEGTDSDGATVEGTATTPAHEGRASMRYNDAELIAFGDGIWGQFSPSDDN